MKLRHVIGALVLLVAACSDPLSASLDDTTGTVDDWAVDLLGAFGIQAPAGDVALPAVVWVDDDGLTVVIAYPAAPCRQYPQIDVRGSLVALDVTVDPQNDGSTSCNGSDALWGLALVLDAPVSADAITARLEG